MAISHVNTQGDTNGGATSVTATKPTGTASGDLLLAFFVSNSQDATPPSGWTEILDATIEVFRSQIYYKVAGGSEPANYTFSVDSSAPLVLSITCLRGVDTSDPIDIDIEFETANTHSEAYTTPGVSGGSSGRLLYYRQVRDDSTNAITFTASGVTELADRGAEGSTVSYSHGIYLATSDYATSGAQSGLAITASSSETHNIVATIGIKSASIPGEMEISLPEITTITMAGDVAAPAELEVELPLLEMTGTGLFGNPEGPLDIQVPISVETDAVHEYAGALGISVLPIIEMGGETRRFAENVVDIDRDERWLIITQDGYELGIRAVSFVPFVASLPRLVVQFSALTDPAAPLVSASVTANEPSISTDSDVATGTASASVTANEPTISHTVPKLADAGEVTVSVVVNQPTVRPGISVNAGHASVTCHN